MPAAVTELLVSSGRRRCELAMQGALLGTANNRDFHCHLMFSLSPHVMHMASKAKEASVSGAHTFTEHIALKLTLTASRV
jgi:hypothetical protein